VYRLLLISSVLALAACGGGALPSKNQTPTQALTGTAELLEFEAPAARTELFKEVARQSQVQAGASGAVLFPLLQNGEFVAAPGFDARFDLLGAPDAGAPLVLVFATRDPFSEDRRDSFQGLSEREAAELIARSLLFAWGVHPTQPVTVTRAAGAPYAAAWMDGELRLNPAFVYMAAAPTTP